MRNIRGLAVILSSGLILGAVGAASAQELAMATPAPQSALVVFANKDGRTLSPTALKTVSVAADEARSGTKVTLVGRAEETQAVKHELIRRGVAGDSIAVREVKRDPIAKTSDGLSDPVERRVEIKL